ncbi:helix-turn-helix domain-containing protein [Dactylosporangium sp. NPDC051541]|uniref:helix-turn-helix domain-containing protein n=1 Tax=Dactylosporangium sp. NPDC051541 TaxID=3363977 RepID=UPI0037A2E756
MSDDVKRSTRSRATRRNVVTAAADLFIANGYGATTLEQIAERAGVAVQTVYFHFGNKRTVLKEAVDMAAVGDDEPVPLMGRPWWRRLRQERDPARIVAAWVRNSREILGRVGPIMSVVRDAAAADPDMAAQWAANRDQRATAMRYLAGLLAERGGLRPGLTVETATDAAYALLSIEVYLLLTADRGWTPAQWQRWATEQVTAALLRHEL